MIRVMLANEPESFYSDVRQPGLRAASALVGDLSKNSRGNRFEKVAESRDRIPASAFPPYWRRAAKELHESYNRICFYLCLYIPKGTGAASVDHMAAKSSMWNQVYEWSNYWLACSLMNSRKREYSDVLDPFDVEHGWFELNLYNFRVEPGRTISGDVAKMVSNTILRLKLNDRECCGARAKYANDYWSGDISLDYLFRHAPFIANELKRQGRVRLD